MQSMYIKAFILIQLLMYVQLLFRWQYDNSNYILP
jgi:hypothetical protein